jgi:S-phase kinase-associated protein 1
MASGDHSSAASSALDNTLQTEDNTTKVKLRSFENNVFEIGLAAAKMSVLVKNMLEALVGDDGEPNYDEPIPLTNDGVTDEALKKIIEWCEYHWDDPPIDEDFDDEKDRRNEDLSHWDKNFIEVEDQALLFDIIVAANYMDIKGLVEVGAKHICNKIKGKTCQEVRDILKITNDFTKEEEEAIHKENEWIYAKD